MVWRLKRWSLTLLSMVRITHTHMAYVVNRPNILGEIPDWFVFCLFWGQNGIRHGKDTNGKAQHMDLRQCCLSHRAYANVEELVWKSSIPVSRVIPAPFFKADSNRYAHTSNSQLLSTYLIRLGLRKLYRKV